MRIAISSCGEQIIGPTSERRRSHADGCVGREVIMCTNIYSERASKKLLVSWGISIADEHGRDRMAESFLGLPPELDGGNGP